MGDYANEYDFWAEPPPVGGNTTNLIRATKCVCVCVCSTFFQVTSFKLYNWNSNPISSRSTIE